MRHKVITGIMVGLVLAAQAVYAQVAPVPPTPLPPFEIVIEAPGIMPEGIDWDEAQSRFLITSLDDAAIRTVNDAGGLEIFALNDDLSATVGIEVDEANHRLLAAVADPAVFSGGTGSAALVAYDLITTERLFLTDLDTLYPNGRHFANDVAVDDEGNAYVTDSFSPVIYRVDPEGNAGIFLEDERLLSEGIGLNGIDYHPDGFLLVANSSNLLKVPLADPRLFTIVETDDPVRFDGVFLYEGEWLVGVNSAGGTQTIVAMTSDDDWATATTEGRVLALGNATTVTQRGDTSYYINAYLGNPAAEEYEIVSVNFSCLCG